MTDNPRKRCGQCHASLPLSYFPTRTYHNRSGITIGVRSTCKLCAAKRDRELKDGRKPKPRAEPNQGSSCALCAGLSHRVKGPRCRCGLTYADEPKPELELRRYREMNS